MAWIVNESIFSPMTLHGRPLGPQASLSCWRCCGVWSDKGTLTEALWACQAVGLEHAGKVALTSYQGLSNALVTWTPSLLPLIQRAAATRLMEQIGGDYWRIGGWLPLAVDGSRITTPRTKGNEANFSALPLRAKRLATGDGGDGKTKNGGAKSLGERVKPQVWLTLIWHTQACACPGVGRPAHRRPANRDISRRCSRRWFSRKKPCFAPMSFVGYELWKALAEAGHHFLIRVGGNVRLLRGLGRARH